MSMSEWAKREIEIAKGNGGDDYSNGCFDSALKAFESLMSDGHSGFSIGMTKQILNRLIDGTALTPIEDTDDVWGDVTCNWDKGYKTYQCKRMSSLFKYVYEDNTVKYSDINRIICDDINKPDNTYSNGYVRDIIDEMYPIKMPYVYTGQIRVYCEDFLSDVKNGDFDTVGTLYAKLPDGTTVDINRYVHYTNGNERVDITKEEYEELKKKANKIIEMNKKDFEKFNSNNTNE
jgi:hypothetical protein